MKMLAVFLFIAAAAPAHAQMPVSSAPVAAVAAPEGATAAIPQPDGTTVFVYPLLHDLEPIVAEVLGAVLVAMGGIGIAFLQKHTGIVVDAQTKNEFEMAAKNWAGTIVAQGDQKVMGASFKVGSPEVAAAANGLIAAEPKLIKDLGITPASVNEVVQAKILGKLGLEQGPAPVPPQEK